MGLTPIKQFGRPRSGTNYTRWVIENNFSNVRVLQNVFGGKHRRYNPGDFEKDSESWLSHPNVITDLNREEIEKFKSDYQNGSMIFVVTMKTLDKYLTSLVRYKGTALDPNDQSAVEREIELYNSINLNYIRQIPAPSIFINYAAIKPQWDIIRSFFVDNGLEPIGDGRDIELKQKLAANPDKKNIRTLSEEKYQDYGHDNDVSYFSADIRDSEHKKISEFLEKGVDVRLQQ